ncbi:hypothetical protein D3C86_1893380 [compost metagenome]
MKWISLRAQLLPQGRETMTRFVVASAVMQRDRLVDSIHHRILFSHRPSRVKRHIACFMDTTMRRTPDSTSSALE